MVRKNRMQHLIELASANSIVESFITNTEAEYLRKRGFNVTKVKYDGLYYSENNKWVSNALYRIEKKQTKDYSIQRKTLEHVTDEEISKGRAYLETGYVVMNSSSPEFVGRDLLKITTLDRRNWLVKTKTGGESFSRAWYCSPGTIVCIVKR